MNQDPSSLDRLRDIVEPSPVSWWPLAIGWWVLLVVIAIVVSVAVVRWVVHRKRTAYRRVALAELENAATNAAVAAILKRAAMVGFGRKTTASLSGSQWTDWLRTTASLKMPDGVARTLGSDIFSADHQGVSDEVAAFAREWIKIHKSPAMES